MWDVGTRGRDKQTTPLDQFALNFRCSRQRCVLSFFSARSWSEQKSINPVIWFVPERAEFFRIDLLYQSNRSFNIPPPPPPAYPRHLIDVLITSLDIMLAVALIPRGLITHGGDGGGKLWWMDGLVENQRPTQTLFCIWRCLRPIYIYI